jgi:hypothetical protein
LIVDAKENLCTASQFNTLGVLDMWHAQTSISAHLTHLFVNAHHRLAVSNRVAYCGLGMAESEGGNAVQFFEGVEKLLEIWFTRTDGNSKQCDLRKIPR